MRALGRAVPPAERLKNEAEILEFAAYADKFSVFAFDTEGTGLTPIWKHKAVLMSMAAGRRRVCFPVLYFPEVAGLFMDPSKLKVAHNATFDLHMLRNSGVGFDYVGPVIDTIVMSMREDSSRPQHDLKYLASDGLYDPSDDRYISYPSYTELFGGKGGAVDPSILLSEGMENQVTDYSTMDAWVTLLAFEELRNRLQNTPALAPGIGNLWDLYLKLESPLTDVLYDYESAGFPMDRSFLETLVPKLAQEIDQTTASISQLIGAPINPGSTQQLSRLFFDTWKMKPVSFTKGGKSGNRRPMVDETVLGCLLDQAADDVQREVINQTLRYRKLDKYRGTYVVGLLKLLDPNDRIHTSYRQGGTETTRLSSSGPNLQNIPAIERDEFGLRRAFVAPPGFTVASFDYDQIEMKIMAAASGDPSMLGVINSGKDIHSGTLALMTNVDYDIIQQARSATNPTPEQKELKRGRNTFKTVGFGIMYGETPRKLSEQTNTTLQEAYGLQRRWFDQFPMIERYIKTIQQYVQGTGYVPTLLGWRRRLPAGLLHGSETVEDRKRDPDFWKAMRAAVNMTIQGTAADCMKIALIRVHKDPQLRSLGWRPLLTVHDECDGLAPKETANEVLGRCLQLAKNPLEEFGIELPVQITASGGLGPNWAEAK